MCTVLGYGARFPQDLLAHTPRVLPGGQASFRSECRRRGEAVRGAGSAWEGTPRSPHLRQDLEADGSLVPSPEKIRRGERCVLEGRQELGADIHTHWGTGGSGRGILAFLLGAWRGCPMEQEVVELFLRRMVGRAPWKQAAAVVQAWLLLDWTEVEGRA